MLIPPDQVHLAASSYGWVAATSRRALAWLDWRLGFHNPPMFERCACVGEATADYARMVLQMEPTVPEVQDAEHLARAMRQVAPLADVRVLVPRGNLARDTLPRLLDDAGAIVDAPTVYETRLDVEGGAELAKLAGALDAVVFASPSSVKYALEAGARLDSARCYSIGPATSDALREHGLAVAGQAAAPGDAGLIEAIRSGERR
jgi:uroporphyrinogen III methyltransferase/synthase